jgi:two-component system, OmpR family, response regulator QseB
MHILIVEDDEALACGLEAAIRRWGDSCEWARDGERACVLAAAVPFDLILLDLGLPRVSGLDVLRALKRDGVTAPVVVVTARGTLENRVEGLDLGADDYLVKPFALEELAARIRAVRRRATKSDGIDLRVGRVAIDTRAREARFDGRVLALSRQEYLLLLTLTERAGRVVAREFLDRVLFGADGIDSNALEVHVHSLRRKTDAELIRTVRGVGYVLGEVAS